MNLVGYRTHAELKRARRVQRDHGDRSMQGLVVAIAICVIGVVVCTLLADALLGTTILFDFLRGAR